MKRWIGAAGLSGLTVLVGIVASPDVAAAAPGGNGPPTAPGGANGRTPPPQAATPNRPAPGAARGKPAAPAAPASSNRPSSPTRATGQARAAQVRTAPPAAAARSNRPGSPNRATGQDRAAQVHSLQAAARSAAPATAARGVAAVAAAAPVTAAAVGKVTICHRTSSATAPFELIEIANPAAQAHLAHGDVAPVGGVCPGAVTVPTPGQDVTICHRTSSDTNPFEVLTIPDSALPAHLAHGDVATVSGACPGPVVLGLELLPPVARPGLRTAVLGTVREAAEPESLAEIVPPARATEQAGNLGSGRNGGSLPKTGIDVGSTVLVGLLLLLVGGRMARSGKLRMAAPAALATSATEPVAEVSRSSRTLPGLRAEAPPLLRARRTP